METILPPEYVDVMVTFRGMFYVPDKYYGSHQELVRTKRGFYHKSDGYYNSKNEWVSTPNGYFSIPPRYEEFKGSLMPSGWGGHRVEPYSEKLIDWNFISK